MNATTPQQHLPTGQSPIGQRFQAVLGFMHQRRFVYVGHGSDGKMYLGPDVLFSWRTLGKYLKHKLDFLCIVACESGDAADKYDDLAEYTAVVDGTVPFVQVPEAARRAADDVSEGETGVGRYGGLPGRKKQKPK